MARNRLLKKWTTKNGGQWEERSLFWDCNTRSTFISKVLLPDGSESPAQRRYPNYVDQWIDGGVQKNAWANSVLFLYLTQIEDIDSQYNLHSSPSFFVRLHEPLLIVPAGTDGTNGAVHARAWGGEVEDYVYILSDVATGGTNFNEISFDGYFGDVPPDDYHLTVGTNPQTQTVSITDYPITVTQAPAWGKRYHCSFIDKNNQQIDVEILRKGYTAASEKICLGGSPVVVSSDVTGDDFLAGNMPMSFDVEVIEEYPGQFDEVFATPDDYWMVRVTNTAIFLKLEGLIIPEQSSVPHLGIGQIITITASGGMTNMGDEPIEGWSGTMTAMEAIGALQTTFNVLQYRIREFVGLREANDGPTVIWNTLNNYVLSVANFNGKTPVEALDEILQSFACSMTLSIDNYLVIQRVDILTYRESDLTGGYCYPWGRFINNLTTPIQTIDIRCVDESSVHYIGGGQSWSFINKISEITVECDYQEVERHDLELDLAYWHQMATEGTTTDISIAIDSNGDSYIKMAGVAQGTQNNWNKRQKIGTSTIRTTGSGLRMGFGYKYKVNDEVNTNPLELTGENVSVMVMYDEWCLNRTNSLDFGYGYLHAKEAQKADVWEENTVEANATNETGLSFFQGEPIRFWLYGIWRQLPKGSGEFEPNHAGYKDLFFEILLPENHDELNQPFRLKAKPGKDGDIAPTVTMYYSDAPDQYGYSSEIGGVLAKKDSKQLTFTWQGYNVPSALPLKEVIAKINVDLRGRTIKRLDASVRTPFPKLLSVLYDPTIANGFFAIQRFTYDFKFANLEFSALELTSINSGSILLEDDGTLLLEDDGKFKLQ